MSPVAVSPQQRRLEALLEKYRDKEPRPLAERVHLQRLWREFVSPMRWRLLFALVLMLAFALQQYIWAYIGKIVVDTVLVVDGHIPPAEMPRHYTYLLWVFLAQSGIHIALIAGLWQYSYQIMLVGQRVVYELRKALHEKLQELPLAFFDRIQTGRLLSVVLDDVSTIEQTVSNTAVQAFTHLGRILVGLTILFILNWKLGLFVVLVLPLYVINFVYHRPRMKAGNIAARRATAILYGKVDERIMAVRTIKIFGKEHGESRTFVESVNNLARLSMYLVRLQSWQNLIAAIVSSLATGVVLYLGILDYQNHLMTLGEVIMFFTIAGQLFLPAVQLSMLGYQAQHISVVMRRVFDLMEAEQEPPDPPEAVALPETCSDITFAGVTFTYPGSESPTLRDVSFTIPAGKQVAVMGPSGAGKTSLLNLLMRFYDPQDGAVTLDGHDLRQVKLRSLRDRVTLVMQEPVIFSGTVAENIRYGRLDAGDVEVRRAAKDADLHQYILTLPDGYETLVGERGMSLSGGQRQRLALAASLLSRPSVLLLDDTTSALDPVTEARIRATLQRVMKDRTCFVVTHRSSTALASDLVLVLEDGQVAEFGPPNDLLAQNGPFHRIYENQHRGDLGTTEQ